MGPSPFPLKGECPKGLPVTDELRFLAYNDFGRNYSQAQDHFMKLPEEIRAVQCSDCSSCAMLCATG